jgi:hypothetical protein
MHNNVVVPQFCHPHPFACVRRFSSRTERCERWMARQSNTSTANLAANSKRMWALSFSAHFSICWYNCTRADCFILYISPISIIFSANSSVQRSQRINRGRIGWNNKIRSSTILLLESNHYTNEVRNFGSTMDGAIPLAKLSCREVVLNIPAE